MNTNEVRMSKLLEFPYDSFLMLRLEYILICGDELEAKILRLIEVEMDNKRTQIYNQYLTDMPKGSIPTDQVIEITRDVWVSISHRTFIYNMYDTVKSENTLKRAIKSLRDKGIIATRHTPSKQYDAPEYQINAQVVQAEFKKLKESGKSGYQKLTPSNSDTLKNSPPQFLIPSEGQNLIPSNDFRVSNSDTNSRIIDSVDITVESNESVGSLEHNTPPLTLSQEEINLILSLRAQNAHPHQDSEQSHHTPPFVPGSGEKDSVSPTDPSLPDTSNSETTATPSLTAENSKLMTPSPTNSASPRENEAHALNDDSKQASYSHNNVAASQSEPTQEKTGKKPTRKPRARKVFEVPEELRTRVEKVYAKLDELRQKVTSDPEERYIRNAESDRAICDLFQGKPPTEKRLEQVYMDMWNEPKNTKTGWWTREHMTISTICKKYAEKSIVFAAQESHAKGIVSGFSVGGYTYTPPAEPVEELAFIGPSSKNRRKRGA